MGFWGFLLLFAVSAFTCYGLLMILLIPVAAKNKISDKLFRAIYSSIICLSCIVALLLTMSINDIARDNKTTSGAVVSDNTDNFDADLIFSDDATHTVHDISDIVYVTRTGSKYHQELCSYLRSSKIPITYGEAIEEGYTACSRCGG